MDSSEKKIVRAFSFLPMLSWLATVVYFLFINRDLISSKTFQDHDKVVANIINNFLPFTIILSFAELITGVMIIYYVIHIARLKELEAFNKLLLIIFLVFTGPIAVLVLWSNILNKETKDVPMYPAI